LNDLLGLDRLADLVRNAGSLRERGMRKDHDELLAAEARRRILALDVDLQALANEAQDLVADRMAIGIVEFLEMIDVTTDEAERAPIALGRIPDKPAAPAPRISRSSTVSATSSR
jgi:hypothetical protein